MRGWCELPLCCMDWGRAEAVEQQLDHAQVAASRAADVADGAQLPAGRRSTP